MSWKATAWAKETRGHQSSRDMMRVMPLAGLALGK